MSFDMDLGTIISAAGGDGIFVFFKNANQEIQFRVHADSYFNSEEDLRYELDGNHASIESKGASFDLLGHSPTSGNTTFGPFGSGRMPFTMEGSGWFYGEIERTNRLLKITFSNGTAGLVLTANLPANTPLTLTPGFRALTDRGTNEHKIRNINLQILDSHSCPGYVAPYTNDQARAAITSTCGDVSTCPDPDVYTECVSQTTVSLLNQARITGTTAELLELEAQYGLSFCRGYEQCSDEIDPEQIQTTAYASGYSAGHTDGYSSGYSSGLSAGETSGYTTGYAAGDSAGYTRGVTAGETSGYQSGYAAGDAAGQATGYDQGFDAGKLVGDSEGYQRGSTEGYALGDAAGYTRGFGAGKTEGYSEGLSAGNAAGYQNGYNDGLDAGLDVGQRVGYDRGYLDGSTTGYETGFVDGDASGFARGSDSGYSSGYSAGDADGFARGSDYGYSNGYAAGDSAGYSRGTTEGYNTGYSAGDQAGYLRGTADGYQTGYSAGDTDGFARGQTSGYEDGFENGYGQGMEDGLESAPSCSTNYLSYQEGLADVERLCPCKKFAIKPLRAVCGILVVQSLSLKNKITNEMKKDLMNAVTKNSCK